MPRSWPILIFGAWTVLIWLNRGGNIARDGDLDAIEKVGAGAVAFVFVVVGIVMMRSWRLQRPSRTRVVYALAAFTVALWAYRSVAIWVHDHELPFKVVHTVLAVVSAALAAVAVRYARRSLVAPAEQSPSVTAA